MSGTGNRYEGKIRCPKSDGAPPKPCAEQVSVSFSDEKGVYVGTCAKHSEIRVCEGGVLDALKVGK